MQPPSDISKIIAPYTAAIDSELQALFSNTPDLPMYDHLAYFMGFKNEKLEDGVVYGGKRFRSSIMLMLADWYGQRDKALPFATALELYHNFTLIHDDVVDKDTERRGRPTVWKLFGHDHAINSGDAQMLMMANMLARAAGAVGAGRTSQLTQQFLLEQFQVVVEGQFLDFELTAAKLGDPLVTQAIYEDMIRRKTAELIVAATKGAGLLTEQSQEEIAHLENYGRSLGMAYQICDDVISIWADSDTTGKRNYGDLKEKKKTLPILFAYEKVNEVARIKLAELYSQEELSDSDCEAVIEVLDSVNTKPVMESVFTGHAEAAKESARLLSITAEQKSTLCALVDSLLPKV